jgi:hypothetical protein
MMIRKIMLLVCVFMLGAIAANMNAYYASAQGELQLPDNNDGGYEFATDNAVGRVLSMFDEQSSEKPSPAERITEDMIQVSNERVLLNIKGAEWASFTDTNSMDPIIDSGSYAIEVIPQSEDELQAGDIVAYESEYAEGTIIHRIVYKGYDEEGTYYVMKGDNNPTNDPGRVRFSQIKRVVVAIIY